MISWYIRLIFLFLYMSVLRRNMMNMGGRNDLIWYENPYPDNMYLNRTNSSNRSAIKWTQGSTIGSSMNILERYGTKRNQIRWINKCILHQGMAEIINLAKYVGSNNIFVASLSSSNVITKLSGTGIVNSGSVSDYDVTAIAKFVNHSGDNNPNYLRWSTKNYKFGICFNLIDSTARNYADDIYVNILSRWNLMVYGITKVYTSYPWYDSKDVEYTRSECIKYSNNNYYFIGTDISSDFPNYIYTYNESLGAMYVHIK